LGEGGLLDQAGEVMGDALGGSAVEAEDVRVETGLPVLGADRPMVGCPAARVWRARRPGGWPAGGARRRPRGYGDIEGLRGIR
jgi:hypothetical protein